MRSSPIPPSYQKTLLLALILLISLQACIADLGSTTKAEKSFTPTPNNLTTPSQTPKVTLTHVPSITFTNTPTDVPVGIFALKFYPPLVMEYDPSLWEDKSEYTNPDWMINYLRSRSLEKCLIGVQGPTDFNDPIEFTDIQLGSISYSMTKFENSDLGEVGAMYIEKQSLVGYDYAPGLPIPTIASSLTEWEVRKLLAEEVLATLRSPSN